MKQWLAIAAVLPLVAATGAQAQMRGLTSVAVPGVARTRAMDLRLSQELGVERPVPLIRGMVIRHDFAPNVLLGVGMANIYALKKSGSDLRTGERPVRSRKPAVTFVLKF